MADAPFFSNRGQIAQTAIAFLACVFAGVNAWPSFKANDIITAGTVIFALLVLLVVVSAVRLAWSSKAQPTQQPWSDDVVKDIEKYALLPKGEISVSIATIELGGYWKTNDGRLRLVLKEIIPAKKINAEPTRAAAVIGFYTPEFGILSPGKDVEVVSADTFRLPLETNSGYRDPASVYTIRYTEKFFSIFCARLSHINQHANTVEISVCKVDNLILKSN